MYSLTSQRGITVVEALVGVSILALVLIFVSFSMTLFFAQSERVKEKTKALFLAEEGIEILRYVRDGDWNELANVSTGSTYYFVTSPSLIGTTTAPTVIDGMYTRSFTVENTERDGNDDFVESGGTDDTGGRVATVTVTWGSESVSLRSVLTNLHDI